MGQALEMCRICPNPRACCDCVALHEWIIEHMEPKWISVNERMPEKLNENNQSYLSEYVIGFDGERYRVGQFKVYKYDGSCEFFDGYGFTDKITHWIPLPEPPKEESDENIL